MIAKFKGDHRFLSNFYPAEVTLDGLIYPSVEHAYQAAKTLDPKERERFRNGIKPGEAKQLGRRVTKRKNWKLLKLDVMLELLQQKFKDPILKQMLLDTGKEELQEGNWWGDTYWGRIYENGWTGQNHLGKLLMQVREECKQ